jgi:hypothetical protein
MSALSGAAERLLRQLVRDAVKLRATSTAVISDSGCTTEVEGYWYPPCLPGRVTWSWSPPRCSRRSKRCSTRSEGCSWTLTDSRRFQAEHRGDLGHRHADLDHAKLASSSSFFLFWGSPPPRRQGGCEPVQAVFSDVGPRSKPTMLLTNLKAALLVLPVLLATAQPRERLAVPTSSCNRSQALSLSLSLSRSLDAARGLLSRSITSSGWPPSHLTGLGRCRNALEAAKQLLDVVQPHLSPSDCPSTRILLTEIQASPNRHKSSQIA